MSSSRSRKVLEAARLARSVAHEAGVVSAAGESTVLKLSKKSLVVRLAQPGDRPVIAKMSSRVRTDAEARVYREVLVNLPKWHVSLLHEVLEEKTGWLILEDAGSVAFSHASSEMRSAVGAAIAGLAQCSSSERAPFRLPSYGSAHYREVLDIARRTILSSRALAFGGGSIREVLNDGLERLDRIESEWSAVSSVFDAPEVFCHADLVPKNIRFMVAGRPPTTPVLIDWELAGRGPLAVDLGCFDIGSDDDPLITNLGAGLGIDIETLCQWALRGRFLRMMTAIQWAASGLDTAAQTRDLTHIETYCRRIDQTFDRLGWGS